MGKIQKVLLSHSVALYAAGSSLFGASVTEAFAAAAEHGEAHGAGSPLAHLLWPTVNFCIYLGIVVYVVKRMVNPALKARALEIEAMLQKAHHDIAAADQELQSRLTRKAGISQEQQLVRDRLSHDGQRIAEEIVKNAELSAQQIRNDVQKKVDEELKRASAEVRGLVVEGSSKRARQILRETLSKDDDRRLRQEAINGLFE